MTTIFIARLTDPDRKTTTHAFSTFARMSHFLIWTANDNLLDGWTPVSGSDDAIASLDCMGWTVEWNEVELDK